jgi:hypothetical protein
MGVQGLVEGIKVLELVANQAIDLLDPLSNSPRWGLAGFSHERRGRHQE